MSIKTNSIYSNVILYYILTPFLTLPSQPLLPSPVKLQNFKTPVCRFGISFTYVIESIDQKLISVCLNNDYSHYCLATYFCL